MNQFRSFLSAIVDYAGLFPPASLEMRSAVGSYAEYRSGEERDLLGRFVLPVSRLAEFTEAVSDVLGSAESAAPWCVSVVASDDVPETRKAILAFNSSNWSASRAGPVLCDAVELRATRESEVSDAARLFPGSLKLFFEISPAPDPTSLLEAVAKHGALAKIRTGGVTRESFPPAAQIIRFIGACNRLGVQFKATAGLHHALRDSYPLTYKRQSARTTMYGYLNLFLAAAFVRSGMPEAEVCQVLEEQSAQAFSFNKESVSWRGWKLRPSDLRATRSELALSFGSCSFTEPVEEARALNLL